MGVDMDKDGRVGCAYYVAIDEVLFIEEDVPMGGTETVEMLLLRVQPTIVIIPNRAPCALVELLEQGAQRLDERDLDERESDSVRGSYILRHLVSAEFDYDIGKETLAGMNMESSVPEPLEVLPTDDEPAHCISSSRHRGLMRLAESVNLDSHLSIGCAGAVLGDVNRRGAVE